MDMDEEKIGVIASENHDATATFDPDLYHQNEWHQTQIDQEVSVQSSELICFP